MAPLYGLGATSGIDTSHPFDVATSVDEDGDLSIVLSQGGRNLPFFNTTSASNPVSASCDGPCGRRDPPATQPKGIPAKSLQASASAWEQGMVLVVSLWGSHDLERWLDFECDDEL